MGKINIPVQKICIEIVKVNARKAKNCIEKVDFIQNCTKSIVFVKKMT
jgi:hypothetical protein